MDYEKVFFIGIGGSGMSGLAQLMNDLGIEVHGSDGKDTENTKLLESKGISVIIGHNSSSVDETFDCVVYTLAITDENPEFKKAKELNIPNYTYAEMLGIFSEDNYTIAVSGTHGKTTTTAMVADIFKENGRSPFIIAGSILNKYGSNYIKGTEKTFIVEACEYKKSFLNLTPDILVITNIDLDHLDFYKNIGEVKDAFSALIDKMPEASAIICNLNDKEIYDVVKDKKQKIIDYSVYKNRIPDRVWGKHNVLNASAALAVSDTMDFNRDISLSTLNMFEGTHRRLECKGRTREGALVYDDYAHHPVSIKLTIDTLKEKFEDKKIILIFQPHTYSRTKGFFNDFVNSLQGVYEVILVPIFSAREEKDETVSSLILSKEISKKQNTQYFENFGEVSSYLKDKKTNEYLIVTVGAGDVYKIIEELI